MARRCACNGLLYNCPVCHGSGWRDDNPSEKAIQATVIIVCILMIAAIVVLSWYQRGPNY